MLTKSSMSKPSARSLRWSSITWRSVQSVSVEISPACSATEMKSPGRIRPRVGCYQRTSASALAISCRRT